MNPLIIYGAVAAVVFSAGAYSGHKITANSYKAGSLAAERQAHERYVAQGKRLNEVSAALEVAKNEKKIVYRAITKNVDRIIDRPVYRNVCLDDDGLRSVNDALAGRKPDPGKSDATVSGADATGRQDGR